MGVALAAGASVGVASLLAPLVPLDPEASVGAALAAYVVGFASVGALSIGVAASAPAREGRTALALVPALVAIGAVVAFPIEGALGASLVAAALFAGGVGAGAALGGRIEHAGHLGVVALVSGAVDVVSVLTPEGPSAQIAESEALLSVLAVSFPMLGTTRIEPLLGVGDLVFCGIYVAAARAHRLSITKTLAALSLGLVGVALTVIALARAIPALPFLGAAMVIAHPEARLPPREERRRAAIALLVLFAVLGGVLVLRAS